MSFEKLVALCLIYIIEGLPAREIKNNTLSYELDENNPAIIKSLLVYHLEKIVKEGKKR